MAQQAGLADSIRGMLRSLRRGSPPPEEEQQPVPPEGDIVTQPDLQTVPPLSVLPETVQRLQYSVHLQSRINNIIPQIFAGEPTITVRNPADDDDETLSDIIAASVRKCRVYESMHHTYVDCVVWGASMHSIGWGMQDGYILPTEIRDLPADTFLTPPTALGGIDTSQMQCPNHLLPAVLWDPAQQHLRCWQTVRIGQLPQQPTEIRNITVMHDPYQPAPAGRSRCIPVYPVIGALDACEAAMDAAVRRVGVPMLFPRIVADGGSPNEAHKWAHSFLPRWGSERSATLMPSSVELCDPHIDATDIGAVRHEQLLKVLDEFFNPTAVLSSYTSSVLGGSDAGRASIWRTTIEGEQQWIERLYERIFEIALRINGYEGYTVEILLPRPQDDKSTQTIQQLEMALNHRLITRDEARARLDLLNLDPLRPEQAAELDGMQQMQQMQQWGGQRPPMQGGSSNSPSPRREEENNEDGDRKQRPFGNAMAPTPADPAPDDDPELPPEDIAEERRVDRAAEEAQARMEEIAVDTMAAIAKIVASAGEPAEEGQ